MGAFSNEGSSGVFIGKRITAYSYLTLVQHQISLRSAESRRGRIEENDGAKRRQGRVEGSNPVAVFQWSGPRKKKCIHNSCEASKN